MDLEIALDTLRKSQVFKEFIRKNEKSFFSYALKIIEDNSESSWQLGYYLDDNDKMASFIVDEASVEAQKEDDIFKKPDIKIKPVFEDKVTLKFKNILEIAKKFLSEKYPSEIPSKTICILQNLEMYDTVWNITFVTKSFNTINFKINPDTGKIEHHQLESIMGMIKK
jgi:hypothetical protein